MSISSQDLEVFLEVIRWIYCRSATNDKELEIRSDEGILCSVSLWPWPDDVEEKALDLLRLAEFYGIAMLSDF